MIIVKTYLLISLELFGQCVVSSVSDSSLFQLVLVLKVYRPLPMLQFSSVQSLSRVRLFVTPWTAACQASLSITSSWSLLNLMSIKSVMPSNHLILCHPLLLPPSIFPSTRVFSNESVLHIRCLVNVNYRVLICCTCHFQSSSFFFVYFEFL